MKLACTKNQLKRIGKKIRNGESLAPDEEILFSEFRKAHDKILSNFRARLNHQLAKPENKNIIFAQRLKKRETIVNKLQSRHTEMDLLRMHDIAGMRLIFKDIKTLERFRKDFHKLKAKKYIQINEVDKYDYIKNPRERTGYRGIHDVYMENTKDSIKMHMELQYRTKVQHAWSTTLEIWDSSFNREAKFENEDDDITLFFKYISELFARILEKKSFMNELTDYNLFKNIIKLDKKLRVIPKLKKIKKADYNISPLDIGDEYILLQKLIANHKKITLNIKLTDTLDINKSFDLYKELEQLYNDVVMVQVKQPQIYLTKAYNNYYNDLSDFFRYFSHAMKLLRERCPIKCKIAALIYNLYYL